MELSKEEVFTLIDAYRQQRVLWDTNHKGYYNKGIKMKSWKIVADTVGVDLDNARRKMASLLGSFRREKTKAKRASMNGSTSTQYKSDWFAFKAFSFLLDPALNSVNLDSGPPHVEYSNNFEDQPEYDESVSMEPQYVENVEDYVTPDDTGSDILQDMSVCDEFPKPSMPTRKRSRSSLYDSMNTEYQVKRDYTHRVSNTANESDRRDATSKFVQYLEAKLNLFNPTASAILIHKINQLIFEAEMSSISQPHSYSMASVSPKSNGSPSPPHINPLVQVEVSRFSEREEDDDKKEGIIITH